MSSSQSACAFVVRDCKIGAANILIAGKALLDGLRAALSLGVSSLEVEGDSKINIIDAINGTWSTPWYLTTLVFMFNIQRTCNFYNISYRRIYQEANLARIESVSLGGTLSLVRLVLLGLGTSAVFLARGASLSNCYFLYKQNLICKLSHTEITM